METIQKKTTRTTTTTSTETSGEVQTKSSTTTSAEMTSHKTVSITRKGQFFDDSFFEDTRQDYQDAIKDVLTKWGDKSSKTDDMTSYRQLRTRDMRDENMAVKSSDDELFHKIVVDVNEFIKDGDVSVKTVGEREVVVEGRMEKQEGNRKSSKSFKRSFIFPEDVDMDTLTSVVSSDGVMIIKARRIQSAEQVTGVSQDKRITTVTQVKTVKDDTSSRPLPITKKGLFFDDSFFEDSRQDFQTAVKQVLQKSNVTSSQTDDITTYRNLRQHNLKDENQAVTVSDDQQIHKIIVDVQDFVNGGVINVKTVDEREVVIEGHIEKQEGNTKSSKRFCKRFTLPEDILVESLTCVVSADGVLTIKAPRKPSTEQVTGVSKTINVQKTETKKQVQTSTTTSEGQDVKEMVVKTQDVAKDTKDTVVSQEDVDQQKKITTVTQEVKTVKDDTSSRPLPITKKGPFFDDSFFEDSRQVFQTAVKQVLEKSNVTSQTDDITTYRNLRQTNLKDENQAVTVSDDQQTHKIIVDVKDFVDGGEVTVKIVKEREVVIEGHIEKQEGNTKSSKRFCKRFTLSEDILVESVSCVVSDDGVLTIIAPRKPSPEQVTGVSKTVDVQKTETKKIVQTSTTTTTEGQDVKDVVVKTQDVAKDTQDTVVSQKDVDQEKKITTVTQEVKTVKDDTSSRPLPITKKGPFFDDSFFEDSRQVFQTAVKQVLEKSNVTSQTDDITTYRNLRQTNLKDENQAVTVSDDQQTHKIIVDVKDFVDGGEVTVKIVKEREVVIEGHIEKQEGNTKSSKRFCKRFTLSEDILVESVSCVVSDDGVLTIIAPRKPSPEQVTGVSKTVDVQKTETKKVVQTSTTTTEGQDVKDVVVKTQDVAKDTQDTVVSQKDVDQEKKITTVTQEVKTVKDDTSSRPLPITKKGPFFDDSFFEDSRQVFQTAVKQVLEKSNVTSETDDITTYRNLRQTNPKDENQAVTVSDDQQTHKIIVDVKDFVDGGEVTVKIVKEREVVIEGHIEKQEGNTKSSKRFCKRFTLSEDILVESVSCVVSDDGILTIIAPRKPSPEQVTGVSKTIDVQKTETKKVVQTSTTTTEGQDVKDVVVKTQDVAKDTQDTVVSQKDVDQEKKITTVTQEVKTVKDDTSSRPLPITKKGPFFDDSFFEDSRQVFQTAVKEVLEKSNVTSQTDDITTYRNLRQTNLKDENQAVTVSDDQQTHKIIVDVKDFVDGGEVTVKIVKEREVVIEGHIEKQEGNTKSSKRFCKRFTLSEDILVESVSCVVSDDGVLTIIAPRKPSPEQVTGVSKTIDVQKTETKKVVQTSTTTTTEGQDVKDVVVKTQDVAKDTQDTVVSQKDVDQEKKITTVTQEVKTVKDDTSSRPLPITKKGPFFDDSFFEDSRQVFQTAVKQVLEKSNVTSQTDDITTYRNLRQTNLKDENQAVTVSDDQQTHKIIVDVKDFVDGGEVTVKIVKEREVVIEGHIEKQEGNTKSSKRFCKRFTLSEDILVESVSCVVSDDGVLTIIAPRKPSPEQVTGVSKTVDVQKTETKKVVQTSTTTTTEGQDVKDVVVKTQDVAKDTQDTVVSQKDVDQEKKITTVTQEVKTVKDDTSSRPLPITKKGPFFDDSFFEDSRQVFQTAVKQVLEKSNVTSETDDITTYRNLRQTNPKDENQAVTVSDDQQTHKIIVDVKDFVDGGEVTVKIVKEREVVIEGHIEKQEGNTKSSKRFCKRFTLSEDILVESVSCVVSDDGVLTIIAPRKPSPEQVTGVSKTVDVQKTETKKVVQTSTTTTEGQDVKDVVVKTQDVAKDTQDTVVRQKDVDQEKKITTVTQEVKTVKDDTSSRPLPITKKGPFFDDSFFEDSRQVFQTAVKQVLEKSNVTSSKTDDITTYRNLRQTNLKEENQAVTVSDDQQTHKIILDVQDFVNGGEITIKIVKEREVVIEGHIEKQEGNTKSSKRFCKRFTLSEDILVESVSCVVSADGVLTIIAPRKPSTEQVTGVSKTIDVQKTETKKQVQTSTTTTTEGQDVKKMVVKTQEAPKDTQDTAVSKKDVDQEKRVTTVTQEVKTVKDDTSSRPLSITKKGSFFDDSFFEDSRQVFQTAVKQVLEKFKVKFTKTDYITTYRNLRQRNLKEENQAVTVSDDQQTHKIILDVQDFVNGGEITVKIVKEREVVIEGHIEKQEGNTKSSKRFCKRFTLSEDILVESVSCVVSADGVLTIIAPRKPSTEQVTGVSKTIDVQKTETKKQVQTSTTTTTEGQDVKKMVVKTQEAPKDTQDTAVSKKDVDQEKRVTTVTQEVKTVKDDTSSRPLSITKKGSFFDDSFFEDSRQVFQTAVKQVLEKFKVKFTKTDYITTYRNLRQRNLKEENQAVTVSDDQQTHKIIVDVQDFVNGGEVTVKIVKEKEVVVEGHIEKQEGNTKSTKRFCKRFVLSEDILVESVTCVMSADGVLTIIAPRKPSAKQVTVQKTDTKKQVQTTTTTTTEGQDVKETQVKTQKVAKDTQDTAVRKKEVEEEKKVTTKTTVKDETSKETISRVIVITKKGLFSEDSFFVEIRHVYQRAVKQILEKMKVKSSQTDYITIYRNMRRRNLTEETQAVTTHDDQQSHKIILDVQDFATGGVITVKIVNEKEVVVEGRIEKKEVTTKRFCRRFVLSQEIHVETVSCVMSADGVLVITAPRKSASVEKKETTTKTEKSVEKSTTETKTKTDTAARSKFTKFLSITQKGDFFSDPVFESSRQDFQSAVKSVLEKLKLKASKSDEFTTYRNHRKTKPKNENQAVSVKEENEFTQIVLDVCDFIGGVKVKIVEGSEIVVEGRGNRQEGMSVVSFSFLRRFLVPDDGVLEDITTFMSKEGILTITIPKEQ